MRKISAFGLLLLFLFPAYLMASDAPEEASPASQQEVEEATTPAGTPSIVFQNTEHDFGTLGKKETVKHIFKFTNSGDAVLKVENVKATCGCTGTLLSKDELAPAEQGDIEVTYRSGSSGGKKRKTIFVHTNDPKHPVTQLRILANVVLPVEVRPHVLYWRAEQEEASRQKLKLLHQPEVDVKIEDFRFSSPAFTATVLGESEAEAPNYDIEVVYDGSLPVGNFKEHMVIITNNPEYRELHVNLRGRVLNALRVVPNVVHYGVVKEGYSPTRAIRILATNQKDFEITGVECSSPLISAEVSKEGTSNRYKVTVTLLKKPPQGRFLEQLRIKTNVLPNKTIVVPVHADVE